MEVFGWVGTALALFFFISPCTLMWQLIKGTKKIQDIPWMILIANSANCILWTAYGAPQGTEKTQVWVCNGIGTLINLIYMIIYFIHLVEKKPLLSIGVSILITGITVGIFFIFYEFVNFEATGKVAMIFNIIMYAAPSQKIVN